MAWWLQGNSPLGDGRGHWAGHLPSLVRWFLIDWFQISISWGAATVRKWSVGLVMWGLPKSDSSWGWVVLSFFQRCWLLLLFFYCYHLVLLESTFCISSMLLIPLMDESWGDPDDGSWVIHLMRTVIQYLVLVELLFNLMISMLVKEVCLFFFPPIFISLWFKFEQLNGASFRLAGLCQTGRSAHGPLISLQVWECAN